MTLTLCKECKGKVSTTADFCPHCGALPDHFCDTESYEMLSSYHNGNEENKAPEEGGKDYLSTIEEELPPPTSNLPSRQRQKKQWSIGKILLRFGGAYVLVFHVFPLLGLVGSDHDHTSKAHVSSHSKATHNTSQASHEEHLTQEEREKVCKVYISDIFGRSSSAMDAYDTDSNGSIYVRYLRDDDTLWENVCVFEGLSIVWTGWFSDNEEWGRRRDEDKGNIVLSSDENSAEIHYDEGDVAKVTFDDASLTNTSIVRDFEKDFPHSNSALKIGIDETGFRKTNTLEPGIYIKSKSLICRSESAFDEQMLSLAQNVDTLVSGCTISPLGMSKAVLLDYNTFSASQVRMVSSGEVLWLDGGSIDVID